MNVRFEATGVNEMLAEADLDLFAPDMEVRRHQACLQGAEGFECRVHASIDDQVAVVSHRMRSERELKATSEDSPMVFSFCLCMEGEIGYRYRGMPREERWHEGMANMWLTAGEGGYSRLAGRSRSRLVDVVLSADGLSQIARLDPELLGPLDEALRRGDTRRILSQDIPVDPSIHRVVNELLESEALGRCARAFRRSKVLELFALFLRWDRPAPNEPTGGLSAYDMERLWHARSILLERMLDPPSIPELARLAGINECKLKRGFRLQFGDTVFGLLGRHRMEYARRLLLDTDEPVQRIASLCGYEYQSHFSTAFRRHVGTTPVAFRKGDPSLSP